MRSLRTALTLATATLLVASCASSSSAMPPPTDGCPRGVSQEAYQTGMYECPDRTLVFTFASTDARDNWIKTATQFGTKVLNKGAIWVKVKEAG